MRVCYDSVNTDALPPGAPVYLGYVDGQWPNADAVKGRFPTATVIRVATNPATLEGDMLDVEQGDATPDQAPGWVTQRRQAGHRGPLVYCSEAAWPQVRQAFRNAATIEPGYFIAGYPGSAGAGQLYPGSVGHQWVDHGNYDESVVVDYLPGIDPTPIRKRGSMDIAIDVQGRAHICAASGTGNGHLLHFVQNPQDPSGWSVTDVTSAIGQAYPQAEPFTVQP